MAEEGQPQPTQDVSPPRSTAAGGNTRFTFVFEKDQAGTRSHAMREYWKERRKGNQQHKRGRSHRELLPKGGPSEQALPDQQFQSFDDSECTITGTEQGEELPLIRDVGVSAQLLSGFNHALSSSRLDPFDSFPVTLTSEHHKLMHHWLATHATMMFDTLPTSNFNPMREIWFPLDLSNIASFNCVMAHSAAHLAYSYGGTSTEALKFKESAIQTLNQWLGDKEKAISNDAFVAVVRLLTFERYWGTAEEWRVHRSGLQCMIRARGGLDGLHEDWRLEHVVALISLMSEPSWFNPVNNISDIAEYHLRNNFLGVGVDIHKIRSLWLVSFVQDMRTFMNLSSVHSLTSFPSVYNAIHLIQSKFELGRTSYSTTDLERLTCLLAIATMVQGSISAANCPLSAPSSGMDDLAALNSVLMASQQLWQSSIHGLVAVIHGYFTTSCLQNAQRLEYVVQMADVISTLSMEAQLGIEKCLLNMLCRTRDGRLPFPADGGWTPDSLLSSIHGE